ncbi:GspS/AspS pilotin family protein [Vibrio sp. S4M6]|uniref:GspS/AspS pilotin family protein n=1 Tax=Vibrio sinus TaxID=2946865 RepID=UPI002029B8AA|nr:GspS/AspS pilotin family protein [Vibrio sinus]MCL9782035.1 GspS/AspS pilotin family protein [Vibrio sinus]
MKKRIFSFALIAASVLALSGCASKSEQQQRQLELIASNRAGVLSAELPLEYGPLSIMRASANGTTIEIMMVYNQDGKGAKPFKEVIHNTINSYCVTPEITRNLDVGITYRIKMRNSRGQLMVDQMITKKTCEEESSKSE